MRRPSKERLEEIRAQINAGTTYRDMAKIVGCARSSLWEWLNVEKQPRPKRMIDYHRYILLPCLDEKMKLAGASNMLLEAASGVSHRTINAARNGRKIRLKLGIYIMEALNNRQFQRGRSGPHKWSESRWQYCQPRA